MKVNHAPILIVDDDPNDLVLIQRAFRRAEIDIDIRVAQNVSQARAYLAGEGAYADRSAHPAPLLVLLDLKMPGGSGIELITWLRSHLDLRRMPIVILSSSREQGDVDRAYEAGCNSYLVKPVAFDALQTMLANFGYYWLNFNTPPETRVPPRAQSTVAAPRPVAGPSPLLH